jgi:hypothetical protein
LFKDGHGSMHAAMSVQLTDGYGGSIVFSFRNWPLKMVLADDLRVWCESGPDAENRIRSLSFHDAKNEQLLNDESVI